MATLKTADLLAPFSLDSFLSSIWQAKHLHVSHTNRDRYEELFEFDDLDVLLRLALLHQPSSIELVRSNSGNIESGTISERRDKRSPLSTIHERHTQGYSLLINKLHQLWPPIVEMCLGLQGELRHKIGANLYVTPPNAQCFNAHFDTHDVFILQLHGSKIWRIFNSPFALPLERDSLSNHRPIDQPPSSELVLNKGDLLYIPRGLVHEAHSTDLTSVHLTIGVHVIRELDVVKSAIDEIAQEFLFLRKSAGNGILDFSGGCDPNTDEFLKCLRKFFNDPDAKERTRNSLVDKIHPNATSTFTDVGRRAELTANSKIRRKKMECRLVRSADGPELHFSRKWVSGPEFMLPAFRYVSDNRCFAVGDLPDTLPEEAKMALVMRLISEGLLEEVDVKEDC